MHINLDPLIFRAYDIRGTVPDQLNEKICELTSKAFGSIVREMYDKKNPKIAVGRDARTHGPKLMQAVIDGLVSTGCHVSIIGEIPSPVNYFTICNDDFDGSIQVTASHNEAEFNGMKLQIRNAEAFFGEDIQSLLKRINEKKFVEGEGTSNEYDAITPYKEYIKEMFPGIGNNLSVVVDNGNGVSGPVYNSLLNDIGCKLTKIYEKPDGTFPNHIANPSKIETLDDLRKTVLKTNAQIGIAFDGDGDRAGFIDEKGNIRSSDEIILLLAEDYIKRHAGATIVFTVSNSGVLETEIKKWGGNPIMCTVGHSFVEHAMREYNSELGGEKSGHFFCAEDYFGFDDALVAVLRVIKILNESGKPFSELFSEYPKVFQSPELRPKCPDESKTKIVNEVIEHFKKDYHVNDLDGARIDFGDGAWAGIRQSNTSPRLSICIEARNKEKLEEVQNIVLEYLRKYPEIDFS